MTRSESLLPHIPANQRTLADGRPTHTTLGGMIDEWRQILGGSATLQGGPRWTFYSDDSWTVWGRRGAAQSAVLCAISDHSAARALVSGYKGGICGNFGQVSYYSARTLHADGPAVALAVLDLELTGSTELADWYLGTWCPSLHFHRHRSDSLDPVCGAANCATAAPYTPCDCTCGGENHGTGTAAHKIGPAAPPDWATAPPPRWTPGSGTVEVPGSEEDWTVADVPHRRATDRSTPHERYLIRGQAIHT